ncbi:Autophagy-related protein like [Quillaja saponaria]|uniref:Autophagy-related protein like n=1 Tax=Quillaja saponaria TaxID=32244 RepID=A0AAD7Q150_QUISA|nr:Autophagy-related protein like [Quillaja saponaria]KAJ7972854.1 Autophagy-related protein like [Quillaja saponaria]
MKKGKGKNNGLLPNSFRIISSCLKTVSTNASTVASTVRSAGASVAASISSASEDHKDQVTWAGFDRLELGPSISKCVLLLGYLNGFQVLDVEDASNFSEFVSKRDGPVSFLQMQPFPAGSNGQEGFRKSHPLLLVVSADDNSSGIQNHIRLGGLGRDGSIDPQSGKPVNSPTAVRFYSLKTHCYVHVLRFWSAVYMIRCSPRIVAVGLATQIYCFDALTLENKFIVLTHPVPQLAGQGTAGVNVGYGPMAVGPRWLAYASNNLMTSNNCRLSPQNLTPSPGVSPSTSPGSGNLVARYAMESGKHLAAGIINLGDVGYKTFSKYCQELLPDGSSSPVPSNSGWKVGRVAGTDMDNAGMVVVKDFVSRAVISQFKAHTSPISALCFDPSGTLLVTASVYGNNINIFRIMPSCTHKRSGVQGYDWSSSHVHLYKLHRGITSAMIQDICFSHFSQWIAIVSSKGTCHLFVLSPFGGDTGFRVINSLGEEPSLFPVLSLPWWSASSSISDQQSLPPPAPVVLSVVSRIKYSSFGWLNTVHGSTTATGKVFVPSGALAAVFHNSLCQSQQHGNTKAKSLEHLLVYTPSGHVVQHELLPSVGLGPSDGGSRTESASSMHLHEDEFRVKVEPIQWWDVCRRSEWPEREDSNCSTFDRQDGSDILQDKAGSGDYRGVDFLDKKDCVGEKLMVKTSSVKSHERSHWYLSNAEVQINYGRLPIWQKSKIFFYMMDSTGVNNYASGENDIEKFTVNEVEIRQKELLPVFDHFHCIKSSWNERVLGGERYVNPTSSVRHQVEGKISSEETVICHSKPASLSSTESSEGGSSRRIENFLDLDQVASSCQILNEIYQDRRGAVSTEPSLQNHIFLNNLSSTPGLLKQVDPQVDDCITGSLQVQERKTTPVERGVTEEHPSSYIGGISEISGLGVEKYTSNMSNLSKASSIMPTIADDRPFLQEGHGNTLERHGGHALTEVETDDVDSSSSHHGREQPVEDGENDEMLGGMFLFSEEG